ncbi:phage portal protein [Erythrobacter litoralis]|uniref:Genetic exchange protein, putative n=1 Tax=Erythrobacter litoralis (strain HTCC2594) TaxID=314225 RepID=Q2N5Z3_ERYLH|nr:phage portal protein [Erythrobacter litoralis]ABC64898.1 genetic exchange protein, putative [Erythrobacter litoralis HTCC2594]
MSFLTTLTSAFKGGGGSRVPVSRGFVSPWATAFESGHRRPFDYGASLREAFVENPVAQRAVRIVAEGVGSAPLSEADPKLLALIRAPSAGQSLVETLALHLLLHGNAYAQVAKDASGQPVELFALRPERVSVVPGADGWPSAYDYRLADRTLTIPLEDEDGWPNIIHLKSVHPGDDHYGAGCLSAARQAVAIHNAASEWNRALLANSARPSGALIHASDDGGGLTTDQFERLKAELEAAFSGQPNAGRPMLLEGGLSWQSMAMSPADMDFATLKEAAARDIALAFGVPPMLLGLPGDNTYANYREANRALWRLTLLPLAGKILGGLADGLSAWFADAALSVDLDRVPALSEDRERLWAQVSEASFLSDQEKRRMLGVDGAAA